MTIKSVYDSDVETIRATIPNVIVDSLNNYIKEGDGLDVIPSKLQRDFHPESNTVDISLSGLIKFLLTTYGSQDSDDSELVYGLIMQENGKTKRITFTSSHPDIIASKNMIGFRLVNAMVYMGIPIRGYFDGQQVIYE